jgi:hypothetical protein
MGRSVHHRALWILTGLLLVAGVCAEATTPPEWSVSTLDAAGDVDAWVDMVLDAGGWPHICYQNRFYGNLQYRWQDGGGWHFDIVEHNDAPLGGRIALDSLDQPYVFYSDLNTRQLTLGHRVGGTWQLEHPMIWEWQPDPNGVEMLAWDVAVDPATDIPVVCYTWRQTHDPFDSRFAWAERIPDGAMNPWTVHPIAESAVDQIQGVNGAMVMDAAGVPRGTFFDEGARDLLAWSADQPDSVIPLVIAGTVGRYSDLAVDAQGQSHVVYTDETQHTVNYLSDPVHEVIYLVGTYTIARFTAIALDVVGRPHVAFVDERTQDLMYAFRDGAGRWHVDKVDHVGPYPSYEALVLDGWNNPRLAYYAFGNLKYAVRTALTGDLDGDGSATVRDLLVLENVASGHLAEGQPPCTYPLRGDFDDSGALNALDQAGLANMLAENN